MRGHMVDEGRLGRGRGVLVVVLVSFLLVSVAGPVRSEESGDGLQGALLVNQLSAVVEQARADYFVKVRDGYGLPSSISEIQRIIDEHGVAFEWGFPLTPAELEEIEGRLAIQQELSDDAILGFMALPGYAGFYFDHHNGGAPTVMATDPDTVRASIVDALPTGLEEMAVIAEAKYSWDELVAATHAIAHSGDPVVESQIHRVAIKVKSNRIAVSVLDATRTAEIESRLSGITPVPIVMRVESLSEPEVCTSRANCYSPMKAGVEVWGGGAGSTLGFGISHGGDRQYVMAGHHSASSYTHSTLTIGSTAENEYYDDGIDARAIYASDSQVSDDIFVSTTFMRDVIGTKYPSVGLSVCMSGMHNVDCGTVQDNYLLYSTSAVSDLLGASADYYSQSGDSGAPVYFISGSSAYAVGIHSAGTGDREFARVYDVPSRMGASILTS